VEVQKDGIGSRSYIRGLQRDDPEQLLYIRAYVNLYMLGSPNPIFSISNGTSAPNPTQNDSIAIQQEFQSYFNNQKLANVLHNFDMNSDLDYVAFLAAGIPAGSLTAGGNYIKTVGERKMFFGSANVPCDSCHKLPCDNINNIDERALSVLSSAAAYGFWELATSNNG